MKIIPVVAFAFAFNMIFSSCEDKDPTKPGYQRKPPKPEYYRFELGEAKSYLWAKPGSYWIYKNTKTGDLDTQIVTGFYFGTVVKKGSLDYSKHITVEYDVLSRSIYSSFNRWYFNDQTSKYEANGIRELKCVLDRLGGASINVPFFHPFVPNSWSGTGASTTYYISLDSTVVLQGKTYYNVAKFDIDIDDIWEMKLNCQNPNSVYYWARDVGLIKKEMNRCDYTWELEEYNIIK